MRSWSIKILLIARRLVQVSCLPETRHGPSTPPAKTEARRVEHTQLVRFVSLADRRPWLWPVPERWNCSPGRTTRATYLSTPSTACPAAEFSHTFLAFPVQFRSPPAEPEATILHLQGCQLPLRALNAKREKTAPSVPRERRVDGRCEGTGTVRRWTVQGPLTKRSP
jgi:hypothetical protein